MPCYQGLSHGPCPSWVHDIPRRTLVRSCGGRVPCLLIPQQMPISLFQIGLNMAMRCRSATSWALVAHTNRLARKSSIRNGCGRPFFSA
jgi:hypothetical protein